MAERRVGRLPVDWSRKRKAALVVFALVMTYLHSIYILFFYVTEDEYWWPVWTGMTVGERLSSLGLALLANLGLMVTPFVRAPGPLLRAVLALSLAFGLSISVVWLARDLWAYGLLEDAPLPRTDSIGRFLADAIRLTLPTVFRVLFTVAILLNSWFLRCLAKRLPRPRRA